MKKQLLLMSACVLAYSSVSLAQDIPADTLGLPADEVASATEQVPAVEPTTEATAPTVAEPAEPTVADPTATEPVPTEVVPEVATEEVASPIAESPATTESETPVSADDIQKSFVDTWVDMLKQARSSGKIQPDGTFNILDNGFKLSGKLLCSDDEVESALQSISTVFNTPNFDDETVLSSVDKSLKCVSLSGIEFQNPQATATFKGEFLYPAFKDGSTVVATANGKNYKTQFSLDDNDQTVDFTVTSDKGEKLFILKMQYDTEKIGNIFELGFLAGLMGGFNNGKAPDQAVLDKIESLTTKYAANSFNAAHLLKMDAYRPNGDPVFTLTGDTDDNFDAVGYSSTDRQFLKAKWDGQNFDFTLDYPKTDRRFVSAKMTAPADFRQKYMTFIQKMAQNDDTMDPATTIGQLISGMKKEIKLYGMNDKVLAQLNVELNDSIHLTSVTAPNPQDIVNTAKLTINKDDGICPIQTISFDKAKPETVAVCGENGCKDEPIATLDQTLLPQMMACFGEVPMMATQFSDEIKSELETLNTVYIPGFSEGYNLAMNRYKANEIMDMSAKVSIVGMTKDGGNGGDATIADLGGVKLTVDNNLKTIITQDSDISSNKDGIVTIRLAPDAAPDLMPVLAEIAGKRVSSGCTATSTTCVIDFQKSN